MADRNRFLFLLIALYVLPVVALSFYASLLFTSSHSFGVLSVGVLLTVAGSIIIFLYDTPSDQAPQTVFPQKILETSLPPQQADTRESEEQEALIQDYRGQLYNLAQQNDSHLQTITELNKAKDSLEKKIIDLAQDYGTFQETAKEQQEQTRQLLLEHQRTINEQRETLEKKQQQIAQLEGQIRDLNYEIKTLMEVEERQSIIRFPADRYRPKEYDYAPAAVEDDEALPPPPHVNSLEEASQQLKRCLDIAQKITGGQYMHNRPSRLRDLPVENTALEMRRLFDNLRSENQATILLYSPKDNKLLFVNNPIKSLTGWSPEKFVHQFQELQSDGGDAWKQSVSQLSFKNETQATLWITSKSGQPISFNCQMGLIPTGSFRHYVLGVLYPAK